jgi:dTDP-4-amino-4,6-dideoxygalactose transaminase
MARHMEHIRFCRPYSTGREINYIMDAISHGHLSGDGMYTKKCQEWLKDKLGASKVLLTHSCTAALEMAAILTDINEGDEIIMPSFTFVSTANAFVLRGGVPVFVDIDINTLNIDVTRIEQAISSKTKAIVAVHYAGVGCEMATICAIARKYNLVVIEDAAQGILSKYNGQYLGSFGHLSTFSFHQTKNIISGEGGALVINPHGLHLVERAEIIREKGTNRSLFFRGAVDKYSWVDIGSSYLPNELTAAFLYAQLEESEEITRERVAIWDNYSIGFQHLEHICKVRLPYIPENCTHNGHIYYLIMDTLKDRSFLIDFLRQNGIHAVFHYVPLHSSDFGSVHSRCSGSVSNTVSLSDRIIRLPIWIGMQALQPRIIASVLEGLRLIDYQDR